MTTEIFLNNLRPPSRHPRYKTRLCKSFHSTGFCSYGNRCIFVHGLDEMVVPTRGKNPRSSVGDSTEGSDVSNPGTPDVSPTQGWKNFDPIGVHPGSGFSVDASNWGTQDRRKETVMFSCQCGSLISFAQVNLFSFVTVFIWSALKVPLSGSTLSLT